MESQNFLNRTKKCILFGWVSECLCECGHVLLPVKQRVSIFPSQVVPLFWSWRSEELNFWTECTAAWQPVPTLSLKRLTGPWSFSPVASWEGKTKMQSSIRNNTGLNISVAGERRIAKEVSQHQELNLKTQVELGTTRCSLSFWHLYMQYSYFTRVLGFWRDAGCGLAGANTLLVSY